MAFIIVRKSRPIILPPVPTGQFDADFTANENPFRQGSIWLEGLDDCLDWKNVATTNNTDSIHRAYGSAFQAGFDDPTAFINPAYRAFNANQYVQGTIYRQSGYTVTNGTYHEAQLRLRVTGSAHSIVGYETLFALNDPNSSTDGYAVVRWNGARGDFTTIYNGGAGSVGSPSAIQDLDIFRDELTGTTLKVFRNGTLLNTHDLTAGGTIPSVDSGNPGMGFFPQTPGCVLDAYGWRAWSAGNW